MARLIAVLAFVAVATSCATPTAVSDDFLGGLQSLCGKAFRGRIVSPSVPVDANFVDKSLVMDVRTCSENEIRIPFHVGADRSRTWILTRTATGLRLKHDHRHEDGSEDKVTQYGGNSTTPLSADRQSFPADVFTKQLLRREGNVAGVENVWAIEHRRDLFAYELRRPGQFFRVEFDLSKPVAALPAPEGEAN